MNFELFTWVDYAIVAIIALSTIISLVRGFVREAASLAVWVIALYVTLRFSGEAEHLLAGLIAHDTARLAAAMGGLFVVTLVVGAIITWLVGQLVDKTGLSGTDRLIGAVFGIARGVVVVGVIVLLAGLTIFPSEAEAWQNSQLVSHFEEVAVWLQGLQMPDYKDFFAWH